MKMYLITAAESGTYLSLGSRMFCYSGAIGVLALIGSTFGGDLNADICDLAVAWAYPDSTFVNLTGLSVISESTAAMELAAAACLHSITMKNRKIDCASINVTDDPLDGIYNISVIALMCPEDKVAPLIVKSWAEWWWTRHELNPFDVRSAKVQFLAYAIDRCGFRIKWTSEINEFENRLLLGYKCTAWLVESPRPLTLPDREFLNNDDLLEIGADRLMLLEDSSICDMELKFNNPLTLLYRVAAYAIACPEKALEISFANRWYNMRYNSEIATSNRILRSADHLLAYVIERALGKLHPTISEVEIEIILATEYERAHRINRI